MKLNKSNELNQLNRFVLGTAQLGMDYGIANATGQPVYNTARSIVREAWESGICEFDTAQAYEQSEQVLGQIFKDLGIASKARVITKLALDVDHSDRTALNNALEISLNNLGVDTIYCLMLHREDMLDLWKKGLEENLMGIVSSGRVKHIGISVYSPERAIQALNTEGVSMIQIPTNVVDRRFERVGVFDLADDLRKIIYIRGIFLQGLLLMPIDSLSQHMRFAASTLERLTEFSQDVCLTIKELCIGYIKHAFPNSRLVFGAETQAQVRENLKCWNVAWGNEMTQRIQTEFKDVDQMILNPSLWPMAIKETIIL